MATPIDWAALKELKDAGLTNDDIKALSQRTTQTDNQWSLPAAVYNPETGLYEGQGFKWTGEGTPTNTQGISDLLTGGPLEGAGVYQGPGGGYFLNTTPEMKEEYGRPAQPGGELVIGGGSVANPPPVTIQPSKPINNGTLGQGGPAVSGPAGNAPMDLSGLLPEKQGYESSSNKDFYQRQFQELMGQQTGQKLSDLAAAMRRQEATAQPQGEPFGGDPWSWANLPEVRVSDGSPPSTYGIEQNPQFNWDPNTSNAEILSQITPRLSDVEAQFLKKNPLDDAPSFLDQGAFRSYIDNKNPNDKLFGDALNKVYNNVWTPSVSNSGPSAPAGYALPRS